MKKTRSVLLFTAVLCAVLCLVSCTEQVFDTETEKNAESTAENTELPDTTAPDTEDTSSDTSGDTVAPNPEQEAMAAYEKAMTELLSSTKLDREIISERKNKLGAVEYVENTVQTVKLADIGKESLHARVEKTSNVAGVDISSLELFSDSVAVYEISGDTRFYYTEMTAEQYMRRSLPVCLIDSSLYRKVLTEKTDDGEYIITFTEPSSGESWAAGGNVTLVSAKGIAYVSEDGKITRMSYMLSYTKDTYACDASYDVYYRDGSLGKAELGMPSSGAKVRIEDIDVPYMLEHAMAVLGICSEIKGQYSVDIQSEASRREYQGLAEYAYIHSDGGDISRIKEFVKISLGESYTSSTLTEYLLCGGSAKRSDDGGAWYDISKPDSFFLEYILDANWRNIHSMHEMSEVKVECTDGVITVFYSLPFEYGEIFENKINEIMFGDEDYLDDFASEYKTLSFSGYIKIDALSGMILGSGTEYKGMHVIDGAQKLLIYKEDNSITTEEDSVYSFIDRENIPS